LRCWTSTATRRRRRSGRSALTCQRSWRPWVDRLLAKKPEDRPIAAEAAELLLEPALEFGPDVAGDWGNPVTWLLRDERRQAGETRPAAATAPGAARQA